jgi:PhoH-like ATPase
LESPLYTGVCVHSVLDERSVQKLYQDKKIALADLGVEAWTRDLWENQYLVLKLKDGNASALARVKNGQAVLLSEKHLQKATSVKPRNKEQFFALDALIDDAVRIVTLTGKAGSGKTLLAIAAAIAKKTQGKYEKIILTKPSSQVGKRDLGTLPGTLEEKFLPFLLNYMCNFQVVLGMQKFSSFSEAESIMDEFNMEIVPLQLIRGASFNNCLVIADEVQVLDYHEMLTLGTRISEGSKLVLMGDLNQRDEHIAKEQTGLFRFINDDRVKRNPIAASVHMIKSERGEVSALFSDVFDG